MHASHADAMTHLNLPNGLLILFLSCLEEGLCLVDERTQRSILEHLRDGQKGVSYQPSGVTHRQRERWREAGRWTHSILAFPNTFSRTASHTEGRGCVEVCEVLPQQKGVLVLLPRQAVAVVVNVERLPPGNRAIIRASSEREGGGVEQKWKGQGNNRRQTDNMFGRGPQMGDGREKEKENSMIKSLQSE